MIGEDVTMDPLVKEETPLVFSCSYVSRVYCEETKSFMDALEIDKEIEVRAVNTLRQLLRVLRREKPHVFPAIQKRGGGVTLLVQDPNLTHDLALGDYWMLLKGAIIETTKDDEAVSLVVRWQLQLLRPVLLRDRERGRDETSAGATSTDLLSITDALMHKVSQDNASSILKVIQTRARTTFSADNLTQALRFLAILLMALCSGLGSLLPRLLQLLNRTIFEISNLVRQATPFMLGCLHFMAKIVGGFYLLLTMIYRDIRYGNRDRRLMAVAQQQPQPPHVFRRNVQRPYWSQQSFNR